MVVIDASLAVKAVVEEKYTVETRALVRSWQLDGFQLVAPDFMASEFATALRKKIAEGILTNEGAKQLLTGLYQSSVDFRPSRPLHNRAIDLSVELNQRLAYDSHYLALAESLDCDFWTADQPCYRAAQGLYPSVRWIGNY